MIKKLLYIFVLIFVILQPTNAESLKVGTIDRVPFSYYDENKNHTGFVVELWERIAKDADIDFKWVDEKQFSSLTSNVIANKTDLAVANISVTSDREKKADFSYSIFESGMAIAIKQGVGPAYLDIILDSGILTFFIGAFLLLLFVAHIIWYFERDIEEGTEDFFRDDYRHGIWDAFWWAFVVMVTGGLEGDVSKRILNRILAGVWIVASLFFISTLTAKITTSMTVSQLTTGIKNYKDIKGRIGVTQGSSHQKYFEKKGVRTVAYDSLTKMYKALKEEKIKAIIADYPILSYYAKNEGSAWMMIAGDTFNHENYGIMFPEKSPHIEKVNKVLLQLKEDGFYKQLHDKYFGEE